MKVDVAIISFTRDELVAILNRICNTDKKLLDYVDISGRRIFFYRFKNLQIVVVCAGESTSNATMTAQLIIDHFHPHYILVSGIAGSLHATLRVGDVTIARQWAEYQQSLFIDNNNRSSNFHARLNDPSQLYQVHPNQVTSFLRPSCKQCHKQCSQCQFSSHDGQIMCDTSPNNATCQVFTSGMAIPMKTQTLLHGQDIFKNNIPSRFWLDTDICLYRNAQQIMHQNKKVKLVPPQTNNGKTYSPRLKFIGRGVSGPTFVANVQYRDQIYHRLHARVVDEETASIFHVCLSNQVPVLAIRAIADLADQTVVNANAVNVAANNAAIVTRLFLKQLSRCHSHSPHNPLI
jgi:adenosylhomocysteine nucleosidase